ncbi:DUF6932 family protein [Mycobacterium sp. NPDC003449]
MLPELGPDGVLPPGRYQVTRDEIHTRFVDGRGDRRAALWRDWEVTTRMLGRHVPLNAAWLHGPFVSDFDDPASVQCVYWAEDHELGKARLDPVVAKVLRAFALPGEVRRVVGVKVDTALVAWHCQPDIRNRDEYFAQYTARRGEVDDLLQRVPSGPRGAAPVREDAVPRRGYVEVLIDGYC